MNDLKLIWRVEKKGTGPFQNYDGFSIDIKRRFEMTGHRVHRGCTVPNFLFDSRYVFGFESYRDLRFYFGDKLLKAMKKAGYKVVTYKVHADDIVHGYREVAFIKPNSAPKYEFQVEKIVVDEAVSNFYENSKYKQVLEDSRQFLSVDWG